tara:strand:+ start:266 stop:496 length:231 start_codon:yes stop_codon:yes gene_type:complete
MKTLNDLFQLVAEATKENNKNNTWFFKFSGHVNKISARYYLTGWRSKEEGFCEEIEQELDFEGIQAVYWFIKTRLI